MINQKECAHQSLVSQRGSGKGAFEKEGLQKGTHDTNLEKAAAYRNLQSREFK